MEFNNIEFSSLFGKTATQLREMLDESPDDVERVPGSVEYIKNLRTD